MNLRFTIIAVSLLLLAAAVILIQRNSTCATAPGTDHAASRSGADAYSTVPPDSTIKVRDHELVASYGEAKTRQARRLAASSINLLRTDLGMMRLSIQELSAKAGMTSDRLKCRLDLEDSGIALSDAQFRKILERYIQHEKQRVARAEAVFKEVESRPMEIMKFLLAGDACAQGDSNPEEYNRLRTSLEGRLKGLSECATGDSDLGLERVDAGRPLDSPEFHGEVARLLDPAQVTALEMHLKQAKEVDDEPQEEHNDLYPSPKTLDQVQKKIKKTEVSVSAMNEMMEAEAELRESGVVTDPEAGQ